MKRYWFGSRQGRLLIVFLVIVVYILLMVTDAFRYFPQNEANAVSLAELCARFGFSALVALLFLAVGAFTWLYARDRRVATLLFLFTFASMISITVQTAASRDDALYSTIGGASSAVSLLPLFALLFFFPHRSLSEHSKRRGRIHPLQSLLGVFSLLSGLTVVDYIYRYTQPTRVPDWLELAGNVYFPVMIVSILVIILLSYRRTTSLREKQRVRLFLGGIFLAFVPLLLLTILPIALNHPEYAVDGQVSSLFYFVLPLSIGYLVLRRQVLMYDRDIRTTVIWLVGGYQ